MTSLFRRNSSGNGSGGGAGNSQGQLNNSRPNRQVKRLEFNQAMEDFKTMFPSMDYEVIECVLRSNNGAVDATIDQLLQMSIDGQGSDDSSDSDDSIPAEILERTLEPDSSDEEPPPVYSPPAYDMHIYDRKYPEAPPTPPPRFEAQASEGDQQVRTYRNWNPPLLGNLPDDFLRILPQQLDSIKSSQSSPSQPSSSSSSSVSSISQWTADSGSGGAGTSGGLGVSAAATAQDDKLKQYLEDERIALFLQNEEFMRELQRNRDFLMALERDRLKYESKKSKFLHTSSTDSSTGKQSCSVSDEAVSDDAVFRDKLKLMGKSTRKKLFEIARAFSERTKRRKSKRRLLLKHHSLGTANSTVNLLEEDEGQPHEEDGQPRRTNTQEPTEPGSDPVSWPELQELHATLQSCPLNIPLLLTTSMSAVYILYSRPCGALAGHCVCVSPFSVLHSPSVFFFSCSAQLASGRRVPPYDPGPGPCFFPSKGTSSCRWLA
ncbi:CUE domain-containing protein 1-like isoform X1 [Cololabis saira]|uniref:CUE domain-containing protein 1-like isoform X1 n=2 Tax=Cololabis saira TaxID=129043 RepID=UPI002AD51469|nr:CUE domain-containing protein 1-like isoform X1 [Cololabis saira]XP_061574792.1 CUE domain-containing protein 1-like isoform X1 [Cololabis saira]XP_061574793.1 CUE domain-containing protein 1-like isoform X1 [Cololabis saira]XP_061574794.1 CUE domain-containing protein 1-like isoform X1 [Cololabis saira]